MLGTGWSEQSTITQEIQKTTTKKIDNLRGELTTCKRDLNDDVDEDDHRIRSLSSENVALRSRVDMLEKLVDKLREFFLYVFCLLVADSLYELTRLSNALKDFLASYI